MVSVVGADALYRDPMTGQSEFYFITNRPGDDQMTTNLTKDAGEWVSRASVKDGLSVRVANKSILSESLQSFGVLLLFFLAM